MSEVGISLSVEERKRIVSLWNYGYSPNEIADMMSLHADTARTWISRWEKGEPLTDRPKPPLEGRPAQKTSLEKEERICAFRKEYPEKGCGEIGEEFGLSHTTIRRIMKENGAWLV